MRDPNVPESVEGWWILHRMFSFDRRAWDNLADKRRLRYASHAMDLFDHLKSNKDGDVSLAQLIGHKGDLMLTHYARTYDALAYTQTLVDKLELREFLKPLGSYVSVLEVGMYEATAKIHAQLAEQNLKPYSPDWTVAFDEALRKQAESQYVAPRLYARVPERRYVCFYPMNKKRDGADNWFMLPYEDRQRLMLEHGKVGRSYHGLVTQVISGSVGFDDFEWGVDLYADDPLVFKRLVYEMRFDEASARYGEFGEFWSGVQFSPEELSVFLDGDAVPQLQLKS